jgi:hypothetical protein
MPEEPTATLNPQQELFCQYYTKNSETFSNGVFSYAAAYGINLEDLSEESPGNDPETKKPIQSPFKVQYHICGACSAKLLKKAKIQDRINQLMNEMLTEEMADAELAWVLRQRKDIPSKVAGLREFNKLKGRIVERKELTGKDGKDLFSGLKGLSDEELARIAEGGAGESSSSTD